jgi:hypothetical protein
MAKYDIEVELIGTDSNAFSILGRVKRALRKHKVPLEDIDKFMEEATSGDYNHLLATVQEYVEVV